MLKDGFAYLSSHGYEVLDSFDEDAQPIDPATVDWKAVAAGRATVKVRQLPGPANSMGQVKFGFPNNDGIYLHDTPKKELFASEEPQHQQRLRAAGGCAAARPLAARPRSQCIRQRVPSSRCCCPRPCRSTSHI